MANFTGQYWRLKDPKEHFSYGVSYEVADVIAWHAKVYQGSKIVGQPNGRIQLEGLTPDLHRTAVQIAITASIENGISMSR